MIEHRDVDIQSVAVLERLVAWNAVADHVVDRNTGGFRVGRIAGRLIIQRRRDRALNLEHVFVTQPVEFAGRDAGCNERRNVVEHFASEFAGDAHLRDIVFVFQRNSHESGLKCNLLQDYRTIFHLPQGFASRAVPLLPCSRLIANGFPGRP
jgi:hypothetical protein